MTWKDVFFSAKGRIGRKDFWVATLLLAVLAAPLRLLGPLGDLLALAFLGPHVCLFAKRLHDTGRSGWLAALQYGPPLAVALAVGLSADENGEPPFGLSMVLGVVIIAAVVFSLRVALAKGDLPPNAYGAPQSWFGDRADASAA